LTGTPMNPLREHALLLTRRHFFGTAGPGLAALWALLNESSRAAETDHPATGGLPGLPHFKARARRVIYLFQSGAPSQTDLCDHKPKLNELRGKDLPDSVRKGQRLTGMTSSQERFPLAPSLFRFARHGKSGAELSELLPHTAKVVDNLCFIKSLHTE